MVIFVKHFLGFPKQIKFFRLFSSFINLTLPKMYYRFFGDSPYSEILFNVSAYILQMNITQQIEE